MDLFAQDFDVSTLISKGNYDMWAKFSSTNVFILIYFTKVFVILKIICIFAQNLKTKQKFMKNFRAKSKETFDSDLLVHTKMVVNLGLYLGKQAYDNVLGDSTWNKDTFLNKLSLALALHDIGKCASLSQSFYKNTKKFEEKFYSAPTHNILSWAFIKSYLGLNSKNDTPITKGVLHHHVLNQIDLKPINTQNYLWHNYLTDDERHDFIQFYEEIIIYLDKEHHIKHNITPLAMDNADITVSSEYMQQNINITSCNRKEILLDTVTSLIRACVILADRTVSLISETKNNEANFILSNNIEFFEQYYHNLLNVNTIKGIDISTRGYDMDRLKTQEDVLDTIDNHPHTVVAASAGFGKTLIGLMHFLKNKQKITWVVPRNVIANGTYKSVIQELNKIGETDVKVALYYSGDVVDCTHSDITSDNLEECDIIVTNIDSLLNRNVKNNMTRMLLQAYTSTIIFDEFHEFLCQDPLFPAFIRLMWTRVFSTSSKTILLSATPMNMDCFMLQDYIYYLTDTPILNGDMKVNISFREVDLNRPFEIKEKDSFVITNTVKQAVDIFQGINDENALLIHSMFTQNDRQAIENKIYHHHDKVASVDNRNTIVGTNIIGVGLDVSAHNIYDFVLSPESTIQRGCGRGGRFNEPEYENSINYVVCTTKGKNRLVTEVFTKDLHNKWIEMLKQFDGKSITKKELYNLFYEFYQKYKKEVNAMYWRFFEEGNKDLPEITPHKTRKKESTNVKTISNCMSYRGIGDNVFVTAKDENGNWSDVIVVPKHFIDDEDSIIIENGKNLLQQTIYEFIASHNKFTYELIANKLTKKINKYILKYLYNFDDKKGKYTKDNVMKIATRSDSPLPLFNFKYDKVKGLQPINQIEEEE